MGGKQVGRMERSVVHQLPVGAETQGMIKSIGSRCKPNIDGP